jgi:hemerythrin-like domain-containing protein
MSNQLDRQDPGYRFHQPPGASADAVQVLSGEHAELHAMFARVVSRDEDRPAVLTHLMHLLANHLDMEKQMLSSVVKDRLDHGDEIATQLADDHHRMERILTSLERRKVNSPDVPDLVTDLMDLTESHIRQAETTIFPGLRHALSAAEINELGTAMLSDERRHLTHSHPMLPDSGPLASVTHKIAEIVDRVRDNSSDGGRGSM